MNNVNQRKFPLILKPEKSSGSRGTYVLERKDDLTRESFDDSITHSRNNCSLIEEFVGIDNKKAIEAEMFVVDGKIEFLCTFRTIRDHKYHTIPQCYCSDAELNSSTTDEIISALKKIVNLAEIQWGEYNVELSFNENDEIFIIEINARQGGMRLPEFVHIYSKVDMNKL